ncbi:TPM domain-containing protein [Winogradskyella sp. MIT101101]|uniref:TPM domain-containing protein n=1 Tax=Winogradskyella sp. MIT101101 TaxID=3098297 RepID=UPI00399B71E3
MKKVPYLILAFIILFGCKDNKNTTVSSYIPENVNQSVVYDTSNLFTQSERDSLTQKILDFEKSTTNQAAVLTVDSIPKNEDILYFSTQVAESWGIGTKEKNNGLLITISKYDREIAISTGLGTEKTISYYECQMIIENIMVPEFKSEMYYKGVSKALDSLFLLWD